jgi:hypothetical protein
MAKRKTPKKDKVVDLTPKADKITSEQLEKLQSIINNLNRAQMDIGITETRKHNLLHNVAGFQDQITLMQGEFKKEYGTFDVNIKDGTINYTENGEADKED